MYGTAQFRLNMEVDASHLWVTPMQVIAAPAISVCSHCLFHMLFVVSKARFSPKVGVKWALSRWANSQIGHPGDHGYCCIVYMYVAWTHCREWRVMIYKCAGQKPKLYKTAVAILQRSLYSSTTRQRSLSQRMNVNQPHLNCFIQMLLAHTGVWHRCCTNVGISYHSFGSLAVLPLLPSRMHFSLPSQELHADVQRFCAMTDSMPDFDSVLSIYCLLHLLIWRWIRGIWSVLWGWEFKAEFMDFIWWCRRFEVCETPRMVCFQRKYHPTALLHLDLVLLVNVPLVDYWKCWYRAFLFQV